MKNGITVYDNRAMVDIATAYIGQGKNALTLPPNYDYKGAVNALYLQCASLRSADGKLALEVCTPESITRTVQDMLINGLNPLKKQCYPIVYAQRDKDTGAVICYELQLQSSYFGNQKKVYANNTDVVRNSIQAQCIYKGYEFEYDIIDGKRVVTKHKQKFGDIKDENIIGAYATVKFKDGTTMSDIMTVAEIKRSWAMSRNKGNVHQNFTHEMCCKTVKSRLAKHLNNATDDETLFEVEDFAGDEEYIDAGEEYENGDFTVVEEAHEDRGIQIEENEIVDASDIGASDVDEPEEIISEEDEPEEEPEKVCADCGKPISDKVYSFSKKSYNKPLCMSCQKSYT